MSVKRSAGGRCLFCGEAQGRDSVTFVRNAAPSLGWLHLRCVHQSGLKHGAGGLFRFREFDVKRAEGRWFVYDALGVEIAQGATWQEAQATLYR